jgi:hypothetical protein
MQHSLTWSVVPGFTTRRTETNSGVFSNMVSNFQLADHCVACRLGPRAWHCNSGTGPSLFRCVVLRGESQSISAFKHETVPVIKLCTELECEMHFMGTVRFALLPVEERLRWLPSLVLK